MVSVNRKIPSMDLVNRKIKIPGMVNKMTLPILTEF
jgi:hypothetical protein